MAASTSYLHRPSKAPAYPHHLQAQYPNDIRGNDIRSFEADEVRACACGFKETQISRLPCRRTKRIDLKGSSVVGLDMQLGLRGRNADADILPEAHRCQTQQGKKYKVAHKPVVLNATKLAHCRGIRKRRWRRLPTFSDNNPRSCCKQSAPVPRRGSGTGRSWRHWPFCGKAGRRIR